jgi:hypothetical protein
VFLGLKLSLDHVPADPLGDREAELREILEDVSNACGVALETLNEFLCYDKLEDGMLELHTQSVSHSFTPSLPHSLTHSLTN